MTTPSNRFSFALGAAGLAAALCVGTSGCQKAAPAAPAPKPPMEVEFATPVQRTVIETEEFSGRIWSENTVEIRSRVTGYLEKANFTDGATVKKDEVLFRIDDRTYVAEWNRTKATVEQARAQKQRLQNQLDRAEKLIGNRTISQEEYDTLKFQTAEMAATLAAAEAAQNTAELNVGFTQVKSPLNGRIGRRLVDPGNLVKEDDTLLATVVSIDPIYAYFDFDERTVLKMRRLAEQTKGSIDDRKDFHLPVKAALAGETEFAMDGTIDWVDNQVDVGTGTLRARAKIDNSKQLLSSGMFVRLRVPVSAPSQMLLIPEEALISDQGSRFVYVINDKDEIEYRRLDIGWLIGSQRVVRSGLSLNDRIAVSSLQRIRPLTPDGKPTKVAPRRQGESGEPGSKPQEDPKSNSPKPDSPQTESGKSNPGTPEKAGTDKPSNEKT